ncbi:MAG: F0F1 ATP synthase subunit A [Elusimicrobia bacterium]|nr:F0F1 ATP synthase subunit A [Elusimicrobiota bacterium]
MDLLELISHHLLDHALFSFTAAGHHFVFTKHMMMIALVSTLLMIAIPWAAKKAGSIPRGFYNLIEVYVLFVRDKIVLPSIGRHGERYLGYFLSLFLFILLSNLLGLIPGSAASTGNILVTGSLAMGTLGLISFAGIKEHGIWGFIKSFVPAGVPAALVPLVFVLEVFGLFIRCSVLAVRLFANMVAGHAVMLLFFALVFLIGSMAIAPVSIGIVIFVLFIELLVAFLQAYIFTMLSAIFVGLAVHSH